MRQVYSWVGGRKVFAQYVATVLLTVMALVLRAEFWEYALAVCGVLGIAVGSIAYEDGRRLARDCPPERGGEAEPGHPHEESWR